MNNKVSMSVEYNKRLGYIIEFDEGISDKYGCIINEKDMININYGNITYNDYEETKQRRKQVIKKLLFNELVYKDIDSFLEIGEFYFESIFEKFEKYILDNDIFVARDCVEEELFSKNKEYEKTYKLVICWDNKEGVLENEDNIKIIINPTQIK